MVGLKIVPLWDGSVGTIEDGNGKPYIVLPKITYNSLFESVKYLIVLPDLPEDRNNMLMESQIHTFINIHKLNIHTLLGLLNFMLPKEWKVSRNIPKNFHLRKKLLKNFKKIIKKIRKNQKRIIKK